MMDLHNRLSEIAGPALAPTPVDVQADLARGRRALKRRRTVQAAAGSTFAVAAIVAGFSVITAGPDNSPVTGRPPAVAAPVTQLVAYRGAQPKGYTIDVVPAGWEVQGVDQYALTLAPRGFTNQEAHTFVGKIVIMLQSRDQAAVPEGIAVKVGDQQGVLVKTLVPGPGAAAPPVQASGDTGWTLWVPQPAGAHLVIQFWKGLGMSQDAMAELGAGVHVNPEARQGGG